MAYKKLIKVSNVCQLLPYPYFETTLTRNGITFTDNGDGTITANGTSVGFATFVFSKNFNFIAGNKYYVSTPYSIIAYKHSGTINYIQGNTLFTWGSNWESIQVYMQIVKGIAINNLTFKPQLFDLTEMYGAGHEPTTVEQFRQDFPEEMYDYSPHCWLTSYKRVLACKTKNLFDLNKLIGSEASGLTLTNDCGFRLHGISNDSYGYSKRYSLSIPKGTVVTLSSSYGYSNISDIIVGIVLYGEDYIVIAQNNSESIKTVTLTKNVAQICFMWISQSLSVGDEVDVKGINLQLELGSTATDYVPYGCLTTYQRNLTCKTKNLFDYSKVNNLMYIGGYSINQYFIKDGNKFTITYPMSRGATYLDCIIPLKAGSYTLSLFAFGIVSGATSGFFGLVKVEDDYEVQVYNKYKKIWYSSNDRQSYTMIIEEDGNYAVYAYAVSGVVPVDCSFWDIQLELGDTATNYVPYGHL